MAVHLATVVYVAVGSLDWKSIPKNNSEKHRCTKTKWRNSNFSNFKKGFGKSGIEAKQKE